LEYGENIKLYKEQSDRKTAYEVPGNKIVNKNIKNEQLLEQHNNRTLNRNDFF